MPGAVLDAKDAHEWVYVLLYASPVLGTVLDARHAAYLEFIHFSTSFPFL